jgi:dihydroorotase (multifunctional complex type)
LIVDVVLTNGKAYLKDGMVDCNFAIEEGKIFKIGKETQMPKADEKIDLNKRLVLPGVIDSHVHLRDEKNSYKETFLTGTAAAAAGGVTTVLDMPNNSPVTMSAEALRDRMQIASSRAVVNVGFFSEFPTNLEQVEAIMKEGAIGIKLFMAEQVGGLNIDYDQALQEAFVQAGKLGAVVAVHAEDHNLLRVAVERLKMENRHDIGAFLKAHDENVEVTAVNRIIEILAKVEKASLHFCHVSTAGALNALAEAKKRGFGVTAEVTPHHLLLNKDDCERLGVWALMMPPLRTQENVDALWGGINNGEIDTLGSDHAPHALQEKDAGSVWDVKVGVPGLETTLPLMLTLVHKNRLTLARVLELLCEKPAELFNLQDRGRVEAGKSADLTIVDFNRKFKIDASMFNSKAKFSPFDKWEVQGKPVKTFVSGELVMDEGEIVAKPGSGTIIRRQQV